MVKTIIFSNPMSGWSEILYGWRRKIGEWAEFVYWSLWAKLCCGNREPDISVAYNNWDFFLVCTALPWIDLGFVPCHLCLRTHIDEVAFLWDTVDYWGRGKQRRWWTPYWLLKLLSKNNTFHFCSHFIGQSKSFSHARNNRMYSPLAQRVSNKGDNYYSP